MPTMIMLFAALWMTLAAEAPQKPAKPKLPSKSGIFALTTAGPIELKVSGESAPQMLTNGTKCFYSAESFDRIPTIDSLQGFFANMMDWAPRGLFLIVGREGLTDPGRRFLPLRGKATSAGIFAVQIMVEEIQSPEWLDKAIRQVDSQAPADAEIYVVLQLKSQSDLNDRSYPVRIPRPSAAK